MAIKIAVSNKVKFKVKGSFKDERGADQPFDFTLVAQRLAGDQIMAKLRADDESTLGAVLRDLVEDWSGVQDADGSPLPFTPEAFDSLMNLPGVAALTFKTYMTENGAKEKN